MAKVKKDDQLLIKINKQVKKKFIELCEDEDTSASRELRKYIERYIKESEENGNI